jgi:threonine 3-dehydrogenase
MSITVAKAAGASRIFATDLDPKRRALAKKLGATEAFDPRENGWIGEVRKACRGEGADVLLEMSGAGRRSTRAFRRCGTAARRRCWGCSGRRSPSTSTSHIIFKGCTVLGINGRKMFETWYQMEELLLSGRLELDEIVTHEFPLEQFEKAHETMISGEGIKVVMSVER